MTPLWKVRREVLRIWRQLVFVPMHPVEQAWFRLTRRYFPHRFRSWQGGQPPAPDVAVFLVNQPRGMQDTVAATCRHLAGKGYAVHLVANGGLRPDDLQRILPNCAHLIERPNHGYDFGGYQAAVLALPAAGVEPGRLLLLNDSVWFPALRDCRLLDDLHALGADVAGPVHYSHRSAYRSHIQTYLIAFSARARESAAFRDFWQGYAMSNNRVRTIRNGEMRLTHVLRAAGLTVAALHEAHPAIDLGDLSPEAAQAIRQYDSLRDTQAASQATGARGGYILSNHPRVNFRLLGLPILKKDRGGDYRRQRRAIMAPEAADLRAMMTPEVLAAVAAWDRA